MRILISSLMLAALANAPAIAATDNDSVNKLDLLFAKLHEEQSSAYSKLIEMQIWSVWATNNTPEAVDELSIASGALSNGELSHAEAMLDSLIRVHPEFAEAWNRRATLYFKEGRYAESLLDIAHVLDLEPRHFGALSGKSMCMQAMGNSPDALRAMKEAYAINPNLDGLKLRIEQLEKIYPDL